MTADSKGELLPSSDSEAGLTADPDSAGGDIEGQPVADVEPSTHDMQADRDGNAEGEPRGLEEESCRRPGGAFAALADFAPGGV